MYDGKHICRYERALAKMAEQYAACMAAAEQVNTGSLSLLMFDLVNTNSIQSCSSLHSACLHRKKTTFSSGYQSVMARSSSQKQWACTLTRNSFTSSWPILSAQCQGLSPALLLALIFAPKLSKSLTPSSQPSYAAKCNGVLPAASTSFIFSPVSTNWAIPVPKRYSIFQSERSPGTGMLRREQRNEPLSYPVDMH